jgi:drug/metabolite transporter (DMT)-like permease
MRPHQAAHSIADPASLDIILVCSVGVLLGSSFLAMKIASASLGPCNITSFRLCIAAVSVTLYICLFKSPALPGDLRSLSLIFAVALLNTAAPYFLTAWAVQRIDSALVAILLATGPLIALTMSHFTSNDDRFGVVKGMSVTIGFLGVILAVEGSSRGAANYQPMGMLAAIGAAACYSTGGVLTRRLAHIATDTLSALVLTAGAAMMVPIGLAVEGTPTDMSASSVTAVVYLGVFSTGIAYLIRFHLIARVGYSLTSCSGYLVPIVGMVLGAVILGETVTTTMIAGLAMTLTGVWMRRFG